MEFFWKTNQREKEKRLVGVGRRKKALEVRTYEMEKTLENWKRALLSLFSVLPSAGCMIERGRKSAEGREKSFFSANFKVRLFHDKETKM